MPAVVYWVRTGKSKIDTRLKKFKQGRCSIKDTFEVKTTIEKKTLDGAGYVSKPTTLEVTIGEPPIFIGKFTVDLASYIDRSKVQEVLRFQSSVVEGFQIESKDYLIITINCSTQGGPSKSKLQFNTLKPAAMSTEGQLKVITAHASSPVTQKDLAMAAAKPISKEEIDKMIASLKTDMTSEEQDFQTKMAELHKKISLQENQLATTETEVARELQLKDKLQKEIKATSTSNDEYAHVTNLVTKRNLIK